MASPLTKKKVKENQTVYAYQRVEQDLREKVQDGRLPAGSMLAGRHNLAREYGVSLATAQQAISNLIADGILEATDRRGTFVAHRTLSVSDAAPLLIPQFPFTDSHTVNEGRNRTPSFRSAPRSVGTLGIIGTSRIRSVDALDDTGSIWARQGIRALEQVFSAAGGATRFFDRYPEHLGPYEIGIDDDNAISMTEAITSLCAEGVSALAIVGLCDGKDMSDEIVSAVNIEQVPVVYVSWHEMRPPLAQVYYDNKFAGYQAAQHLLRRGYSRLTFLAPFREDWLTERISGALDAVRHAGLSPEALHVYPDLPTHDAYNPEEVDSWIYPLAKQLFTQMGSFDGSNSSGPIGIIAPNDFTAYATIRAATEQGKIMGADYGLIGFDDHAPSCTLGLTTVRPPIEAMGEEAGRLLLRALGGEQGGLQVRMRSQVIPRASTDLPRNNLLNRSL